MGTMETEVSINTVFTFVTEVTIATSVSFCEYLRIYGLNWAVCLQQLA
jgi:hypothetical protein